MLVPQELLLVHHWRRHIKEIHCRTLGEALGNNPNLKFVDLATRLAINLNDPLAPYRPFVTR